MASKVIQLAHHYNGTNTVQEITVKNCQLGGKPYLQSCKTCPLFSEGIMHLFCEIKESS